MLCCLAGLFTLISGEISAQNIVLERQIITSSASDEVSPTMMLTATLGDLVINDAYSQTGQIILTQGFQQGRRVKVGNDPLNEWVLEYNLFPNPTPSTLFVELEVSQPVELEFVMYDLAGKETQVPRQTHRVAGKYLVEIDVQQLPDGLYLLVLRKMDGDVVKTFKLEKVQ